MLYIAMETQHPMIDTVVQSVIAKFAERSKIGIEKYGTTLDRDDLHTLEWVNHMQEELMDAILYLEKLKRKLAADQNKNTGIQGGDVSP